MEGHSQLANCVRGKTMALFKPWRYLVSKPPNLDVAKEAGILCDVAKLVNDPFICYSSLFFQENENNLSYLTIIHMYKIRYE